MNPQAACPYARHLGIRDRVRDGAKDLAVAEVAAARSLVLDAHGGASRGRCAAGETGAAWCRAVGVRSTTQIEEVQPVTGGSRGWVGAAASWGARACCLCDTTVSPTGNQQRVRSSAGVFAMSWLTNRVSGVQRESGIPDSGEVPLVPIRVCHNTIASNASNHGAAPHRRQEG